MSGGQLRFDPIDQFVDIVLITAWEGERTDRVVHGCERLMYFGELLLVHTCNFGPKTRNLQLRKLSPERMRTHLLQLIGLKAPLSQRSARTKLIRYKR